MKNISFTKLNVKRAKYSTQIVWHEPQTCAHTIHMTTTQHCGMVIIFLTSDCSSPGATVRRPSKAETAGAGVVGGEQETSGNRRPPSPCQSSCRHAIATAATTSIPLLWQGDGGLLFPLVAVNRLDGIAHVVLQEPLA